MSRFTLVLLVALAGCSRVGSGAPVYGAASVEGTSVALSGVAGGRMALSRLSPSCRGYAQRNPSHLISTTGGPLRLAATSGGDTTLAVRLPNGQVVCDDDGGDGLNPMLDLMTGPGDVQVWVGSYSGSDFGYTLIASGGSPRAAVPTAGGATGPGTPGTGTPGSGTMGPPAAGPDTTGPTGPATGPIGPSLPPPAIVMLEPRIPTTLFGAGVAPTIAVWTAPGATVEVSAVAGATSIALNASVNGVASTILEVPADPGTMIVTITERTDRSLLIRAERAPSGTDPGLTMLWRCQVGAGVITIADSWSGTASERGPRWSR